MTEAERIKELEEVLNEAKHALKVASDVQYAQAEELKRLRPLGEALTALWWFWGRLSGECTTTHSQVIDGQTTR